MQDTRFKKELAYLLEKIAFFLSLESVEYFKVRAYKDAAKSILSSKAMLYDILKGKVKIKGIGSHMIENIREYLEKGSIKVFEDLIKKYPESLVEIGKIPGLGVKKIKTLYDSLSISTVGELEYACKENRLLHLEGFGKKSQANILESITQYRSTEGFFLLPIGDEIALGSRTILADTIKDGEVYVVGSIRRRNPIIQDITLLIQTRCLDEAKYVLLGLSGLLSGIKELRNNTFLGTYDKHVNVHIVLCEPSTWAFNMIMHTGSPLHIGHLKHVFESKGYSLHEKGICKQKEGKTKFFKDEESIYELAGFPLIPPELREGLWEFDPIFLNAMKNLVSLSDIKGLIHVHSNWSDGNDTLEDIIRRSRELGMGYVGVTDHSKSAYYARGLSEESITLQRQEIDILRRKFPDIKIFHGIEADILTDGSIDYDESVWKELDFILASIHSNFRMDRDLMTERICRALQNPYVKILGHPTGRLVLARKPYEVDMERVIKAAKENNKAIELNAHPQRLDIDYSYAKQIIENNVLISIGPDAHQLKGLEDISYGVDMARKSGLTKTMVVNTKSADDIERFFKH